MAGSLNRVQLLGYLGRDPEVRNTQAGARIVSFRIATTESWKGSDGERRERTEWHSVVIFNDALGKIAERYLRKGSRALIEGSLQTRKWTDTNGVERWSTEIVLGAYNGNLLLLDNRPNAGSTQGETSERPPVGGELDDDIPF
ncbi:single-stranded DNA-binding protein [Pseudoroseomonas sp. WGS1072]|uniref:single-stranded DNA-binding protein n=1 Tax=Roseomonas sp. WGS1072 TaxID=3366816 RepID=UPI003BF042EB